MPFLGLGHCQAEQAGLLKPAPRLAPGMLLDEVCCRRPEGLGTTRLALQPLAVLGGDDVFALWRAGGADRRQAGVLRPASKADAALARPPLPCRSRSTGPSVSLAVVPPGRRKRSAHDFAPLG